MTLSVFQRTLYEKLIIKTNMSSSKTDVIYPCFFSKAYGIPTDQAWNLLKFFFLYRTLLASCFIVLAYFPLTLPPFIYLDHQLFKLTSLGYFSLTLMAGISILTRRPAYTPQAQLLILTDIVAITLIMHGCGGVNSGIGILLVISITFGGILIGGRCAMLFAALATIAILTEQTYAVHTHKSAIATYTGAGLLGAAFFTTALLAYILAQRSEQNQLITQQHKQTILKLEELNQSIIQHLQSGIIITNRHQQIQMSNQSTLRLLNITAIPEQLREISTPLADAFEGWLTDPGNNFIRIQTANQNQIHSRFSFLPTQQEMLYMVMLEDVALYNQRLQQSKLASLGRLTASIAHEIRNPLSAITHAGQLLAECPTLPKQDQRLLEIIQTHSQRINGIIEEVLQLSRRKTSQRHKIAINEWLTQYLENFIIYQYANPEQITVKLSSENLQALIDPDHLEQIMNNLCQNAFKHNHASIPHLTIITEPSNRGICINIADNGEGISPANLEHLFEPFFTTSATGTGLGLYISKELAELNEAYLTYHPPLSQHIFGHLNEKSLSYFQLCLPDAQQPTLAL